MSLTLITAPTVEPITVAEARRHLKLGSSAGEPAPIAVTAALASPAAPGNVDNGAHRYLATFVTADGETEAGLISAAVTVADLGVNGQIELTAIPIGGVLVTSRKIYRTEAGASTYKLLTTLADNTTAIYTDNTADSGLGAAAPATNTTEDPQLLAWITAVRERCETFTGRVLLEQTWELGLDCFPTGRALILPRPPLLSVTTVKYDDTTGTEQTWAAANYTTVAPAGDRAERGRVALAFGATWPATRGEIDDVRIRYQAGYGATAASVPELLRTGMLMDLGTLYAQREAVVTLNWQASELPLGVRSIYKSYRSVVTQRRAVA